MRAFLQFSLIVFLVCPGLLSQSFNFYDYFMDSTLRVDFYLHGNSKNTKILWHQLKVEKNWAGRKEFLIDTLKYGGFLLEVYCPENKQIIFSKSFSTFFEEWQTTEEAKTIIRSFEQTIQLPFPKKNVEVFIYKRNYMNDFELIGKQAVNSHLSKIIREKENPINHKQIVLNGPPNQKVDIVILGDGYTINEMDKYKNDIKRFVEILFNTSPFSEYKESFNITYIETVSEESGSDIPYDSVFKNTALNTTYYTFNSERYLTSMSNFIIRDYASVVPYDYIYVIVNSEKYGGGGVYNHLNFVSSDNPSSGFVFIHEFGHGFAGLADEYYTSEVAVQDFYNLQVEPVSPNITTLVNFTIKWKDMLEPGIPIPTPEKEMYFNRIGVFEGAGYSAKGIYRPYIDCIMKTRDAKEFCPICKRAIIRSIQSNCD